MPGHSTLRFGPDRRLALLACALALLFAALVVATTPPAGRIIYTLAALGCAAVGVGDLLLTPRLIVSSAGLRVRPAVAWSSIEWDQLESVEVDRRTRHGLAAPTLEIDDGDTLILLSRHALGADPQVVADLLNAFRRR